MAISVVEVKTDNGMVGVEVILLFGSISIHGVEGEVGTIVMDIDSGHGVMEEIARVGVVLVEEEVREDKRGEVLEVSDEKGVGKAEREVGGFCVLREYREVGKRLVVLVSIEFSLMEEKNGDVVKVDIDDKITVLKEEIIAFVDVCHMEGKRVGETLEVLCNVVR